MIRALFLLLLLGLMKGLSGLEGADGARALAYEASMAFGFLILSGWVAGEAVRRIRLPRITGYLLAGILCGPHLLAVLDVAVIGRLQTIDRLALFFIALTAGGELDGRALRERLGTVLGLALSQLLLGGAIVFGALLALARWLPVLQDLEALQLAGAAALLAVVSSAISPATTVAVIVETRARGPMRDLALGATVLVDVLVIVVFTLVLGRAAAVFGVEGGHGVGAELLGLGLSLGLGALCGVLGARLLPRLGRLLPLGILLAALALVQLCADLGLDALMLAVAAGYAISNHSPLGIRFLHGLEEVSQPVFLVFFGIAGAVLDLPLLLQLWPLALLFVGLRLVAKWSSVSLAARAAKLDPRVAGPLWMSFLGQAGVSLGFASLIAREIPGVGTGLREIVVAAVVLNQVIGPVLFKLALEKAGEIPRDGS